MARGQPRRQGVVYGPVRPPDSGRDRGAVVGRIMGVLIILLAVGLLGAAGMAFLNERGQPSPSPTAFALVNPSADPSRLPTPAPTPSQTPSDPSPTTAPSAPVTPSPSPSPSPFVPLVQVGPGFVTFGTRSDADLNVVDPRSTFSINQRMLWSAYLSEPLDSATLHVRMLKMDAAAAGGERLLSEAEINSSVPNAQRFLRRISPARVLEGPGVYIVRYVSGDTVLSEGYFLIEG